MDLSTEEGISLAPPWDITSHFHTRKITADFSTREIIKDFSARESTEDFIYFSTPSTLVLSSVAVDNTSVEDVEAILQALSDERALELLPVLVLYGVFLLTGVLGNSLTVYIYWTKFKATWSRTAIVTLGVFDLISCCCTIPSEVYDLRYSYNYSSDVLCRVTRLVATFPNIASGIMLTTVALDRYRLICTPLKSSQSRGSARRHVLGVCVLTSLVTWPAAVVYGTMHKATKIGDVTGRECSTSDMVKYTKIPLAYNLLLGAVFLTAFVAMIVFYTLIARQIYRQGEFRKTLLHMGDRKRRSTLSELEASDRDAGRDLSHDDNSMSHRSCSREDDTSGKGRNANGDTERCNTNGSVKRRNTHVDATMADEEANHNGGNTASVFSLPCSPSSPTCPKSPTFPSSPTCPKSPTFPSSPTFPMEPFPRRKSSRTPSFMRRIRKKSSADSVINSRTRKTTFMLCFISIVFVVSFLPHIVVKLIRTLDKDFLTGAGTGKLIAYNLCARSYFLNSVANVFIYGFCSLRFRKECKKILRKLLFCKTCLAKQAL